MTYEKFARPPHTVISTLGAIAAMAAASTLSCSGRFGAPEVALRSSGLDTTTPVLPQFLVYGERSVTMGSNDHASGGDIGVESAAASSFGPQLSVAQQVVVDASHTMFAPSVTLGAKASVGDVFTSSLTNNGATHGSIFAFPASGMPAGPFVGVSAAGTTNVSVVANTSRTLAPGNYGALTTSGIVFLNPGSYSFASVTIGSSGQLVANGGGITTVVVAGQLSTATRVTIAALSGGAGNLVIYVDGSDGPGSAATIGTYSSIVALIAAPHGTLSIGDHSDAKGAFAGFDVAFGQAVVLTYQQGFSPPATTPAQQLSGYVTPPIAAAPLVGPVPQSTVIDLAIGLALLDPAGLVQKVRDVSDPSSSSYRSYLHSVADFTAAYSPSTANYAALTAWATAAGLTVTDAPANRLLLNVRGTAGQIEQTLSTGLVYRARPDGSSFYALDREPAVSLPVSNPILWISGLDNRVLATPQGGSAPNGGYTSSDIRSAYAACTSNTGSTQSLGLLELDGYTSSDITAFECRSNLVTCDPTGTTIVSGVVPTLNNILVNGFSGAPSNNANQVIEVTGDISAVISMAPGLQQVAVYEAQNSGNVAVTDTILNKMALNTSIRQFSNSWNISIDANTQTSLYEMAVQGQSFIIASGDFGSSSWNGDPADIRDEDAVTVLGGTTLTLTGPPQTYGGETTWNVTASGASGGGFANKVIIPHYQEPFNLAASGQPAYRQLPDLSMVAANAFFVINGKNGGFNGTSLAAPLWAGFTALANDYASQNNLATVGFANPFLYSVAVDPATYPANFNDINDGSNNAGTGTTSKAWTPTTGKFVTAAGYDLATGLGAPRCALLNALGTGTIATGTGGAGGGGTGGAGGTGGTSGPTITSVTAVESSAGLDICMSGAGFTPGDFLTLTYSKVQGVVGGLVGGDAPQGSSGDVAGDGSFTYDDETFSNNGSSMASQLFNAVCGMNGADAVVNIKDTTTGQIATAPLTSAEICNLTIQSTQTGNCPLPF